MNSQFVSFNCKICNKHSLQYFLSDKKTFASALTLLPSLLTYSKGAKTLSCTTFSITTLSITTLSIKGLFATLSINDTHRSSIECFNAE